MDDFEDISDSRVLFADQDDTATDFFDIGDGGVIIVEGFGYGEGGYGEGGYGGDDTLIISYSPTVWTDLETP